MDPAAKRMGDFQTHFIPWTVDLPPPKCTHRYDDVASENYIWLQKDVQAHLASRHPELNTRDCPPLHEKVSADEESANTSICV